MRRLREIIEDSGFASFYLSLTPGNLRTLEWVKYSKALSGRARELASFLLLGVSVPLPKLRELITSDCLDALVAAGIVTITGNEGSTSNFRLLCWEGVFFFAEVSLRPTVYFGADSLALNVHHSYLQGSRALDLCAGPGIQALTLARRGFEVDAVELNPLALAIGRVNVALNGLEDRITYHLADVAEFVKSPRQIYDVVVMNPPLLPIASDLEFPFVGDGGEDGQNLAKIVLENARNLLAGPRSRFVFVGLTPGRRDGVVVVEEHLNRIAQAKQLDAILFILGRHAAVPGNAFFDGYVRALQIYNGGDPDEVSIRVAEYLRRNRIQEMDQYVVIASLSVEVSSKVTTNDLGSLGLPDWFS